MTDPRFTLDRASHTIRIQRRIRATPDWLFQSWVDPAQLSQWWDPTGKPLTRCEIDLRVGGGLLLATEDHTQHPFAGTYTRIEPPNRLEFDALSAHGTVTFRAMGETTEMVLELRCASAEHLEQFLQLGVAEGTALTVDNLVNRAERQRAA